jgi:hypothetical protein
LIVSAVKNDGCLSLGVTDRLLHPDIRVAGLASLHLNMNALHAGDDVGAFGSPGELLAPPSRYTEHLGPGFAGFAFASGALGT